MAHSAPLTAVDRSQALCLDERLTSSGVLGQDRLALLELTSFQWDSVAEFWTVECNGGKAIAASNCFETVSQCRGATAQEPNPLIGFSKSGTLMNEMKVNRM